MCCFNNQSHLANILCVPACGLADDSAVCTSQVDECGPVHITIGDGGNIEGLYKDYIDELQPQPGFCTNPQAGQQFPSYQPQQCISIQNGRYCPDQQPEWSAYREPSFGHGMLELVNATHAEWTWNKNQWPAWKVADRVTIIRGGNKACGSRDRLSRHFLVEV